VIATSIFLASRSFGESIKCFSRNQYGHTRRQICPEYRLPFLPWLEEAPYPPRRKASGYGPCGRWSKYRVAYVLDLPGRSIRTRLLRMAAKTTQITPTHIRVPGETLSGETPCCCFKISLLGGLGASSIPIFAPGCMDYVFACTMCVP